MEILPPQKIKATNVQGKGRGVIATQDIKKGEIIEFCPVIFISKKEADFLEKENTVLGYYCLWQFENKKTCVMLGYGSLYNHSTNPNAEIDYNTKKAENYVFYRALKKIQAGEEIVWDYEFENGKEDFLKI